MKTTEANLLTQKQVTHEIKKKWPKLEKKGQKILYKKGQVLFYEGHYLYGLYFLLKGKVEFVQKDHVCSTDHHVDLLNHQLIGLESFTNATPSCCTAVAQEACEVLFIPKSVIFPFTKA